MRETSYGAFEGCTSLREVRFGTWLKKIGTGCFRNCVALTEVDLPQGLTSLYGESFSGCVRLSRVAFPSTLEDIGYRAFDSCSALKEIELPASLQRLNHAAFSGCASLERVFQASRPPNAPAQIWQAVIFRNCANLREIRIPAQVKEMDGAVFHGCTSLERWNLDPENPWLRAEGPWLLSRDRNWLISALPTISGEVSVPGGVRQIRRGAFLGCAGLTAVTIPASVEYIHEAAFGICPNLMRIDFLGRPIEVHEDAFVGSPIRSFVKLPAGTRTRKALGDPVMFYW